MEGKMTMEYSFPLCRAGKRILKCIFEDECQLEAGCPRCRVISSYVNLLSPNSHNLSEIKYQFYCPGRDSIISTFLCLRSQHADLAICQNCQAGDSKFFEDTDLGTLVKQVLEKIKLIDAENRKHFKITQSNENHELSKFPDGND